MRRKEKDIILISNSTGHSDLFIILPCDRYWSKIQNVLLPGQMANALPDSYNRVFQMNLKLLLKNLLDNRPVGCVLV